MKPVAWSQFFVKPSGTAPLRGFDLVSRDFGSTLWIDPDQIPSRRLVRYAFLRWTTHLASRATLVVRSAPFGFRNSFRASRRGSPQARITTSGRATKLAPRVSARIVYDFAGNSLCRTPERRTTERPTRHKSCGRCTKPKPRHSK